MRSLTNLPVTLDDTYDRILPDIKPTYKHLALQVLRWLALARISLTVAQITHVTGFVDDGSPRFDEDEVVQNPRDIFTVCKSLVTIVEADHIPFERSVIRLAHFTVRQYLTSDRIGEIEHASFYRILEKWTEALIGSSALHT